MPQCLTAFFNRLLMFKATTHIRIRIGVIVAVTLVVVAAAAAAAILWMKKTMLPTLLRAGSELAFANPVYY